MEIDLQQLFLQKWKILNSLIPLRLLRLQYLLYLNLRVSMETKQWSCSYYWKNWTDSTITGENIPRSFLPPQFTPTVILAINLIYFPKLWLLQDCLHQNWNKYNFLP